MSLGSPACPSTIINGSGTYYFHCVVRYVPPQALDIRYWYFGFFVIMLFVFLIDGFAIQNGVQIGSDTFIYLTLIGLFIGGLMATLLDVMSWIMPVTMVLILVVYTWRTRS